MRMRQGAALIWAGLVLSMAGVAAAYGPAQKKKKKTEPQPSPRTWHVKSAELRFLLSLPKQWSLPCDDYLADLKPIETKDIILDPMRGALSPSEGKSRTGGTVVYAVEPRHRWIIYSHRGGASKIFADEKKIGEFAVYSRQTAKVQTRIPEGTRKIKLMIRSNVKGAGLTFGPRVAKAQICLPGGNSAGFEPLVYAASGKRVACKVIRIQDAEPMVVLFDCSSGETDYFLYLVGARQKIGALDWNPPAGLLAETRYWHEYDASVETYGGFIDLWKRSKHIAGRMLVNSPHLTRMPPFPSLNPRSNAPSGAPLVLSQCKGVMYVPKGGKVHFYTQFRCGGYLLIDGKLFIHAGGLDPEKREDEPWGRIKPGQGGKELNLGKGLHTYQLCVYGTGGHHYGAYSTFKTPFGQVPRFPLPVETSVGAPECRDANKRIVSVVCPDPFSAPGVVQRMGRWPARNMAIWPLKARISGGEEGVTFRWKFPNGREVEGRDVSHIFFRDGIYPVTVEALRSGDRSVLASTTARIRVLFNWIRGNWHYGKFDNGLMDRADEFGDAMPLEDLLNIHAHAVTNFRRPMMKLTSRAIDKRIDEVLKARAAEPAYLLWLGKLLSVPPGTAHDSARRLLEAAYQVLEPGTLKRQEAAMALCDLLTDVYEKPAESIKLIEDITAQEDPLKLSEGWQVARVEAFHPNLRKLNVKGIVGKLAWGKEPEPLGFGERTSSRLWLRKTLDLKDRDNSRPLYLNLGSMFRDGMIYFNHQPLCEPWECPGGMLAVPPSMLRKGVNELLIHFRPPYPDNNMVYFSLSGPGNADLGRRFDLAKARAMLIQDKTDVAVAMLKEATLRMEVAKTQPKIFIQGQAWQMLGPFKSRRITSEDLKGANPDEEWKGMAWKPVDEASCRGMGINIGALVPAGSSMLLYTSFNSERAYDSDFASLGGNSMVVYLNGEAILGNIGRRGRGVSQRIARVKEGKNELIAIIDVSNVRFTKDFFLSMTNPESEVAEVSLASQLRKAKLWANDGNPDHADASYEFLMVILNRQPDQYTNLDVMETLMFALIGRHDFRRAQVLSKRLLKMALPEIYERSLLWGQVQIRLGLRELDEAREIYKRLNKDFPYSEETLKAREAIIAWVMEEKKKQEGSK